MERGRRSRRRNGRCCPSICPLTTQILAQRESNTRCSFLGSIFSILLMTSLMAVIYLLLEQHCITCGAKCSMNNITKHIEDIAKNLTFIQDEYCTLEQKISKVSQQLPKVEGHVGILEELANTLRSSRAEFYSRIDSVRERNAKDLYQVNTSKVTEPNITKPPKLPRNEMKASGDAE